MNESTELVSASKQFFGLIDSAKDQFLKIVETDPSVDWERESVFAYQMLTKNSFSIKTAKANPGSVKLAIINVAATGLTLNPAHKYAYLVPRDGQICLDISYQGLIKVATDSGSILWAKANLIYEGDTVTDRGLDQPPEVTLDPFNPNRGTDQGFKGVYCTAKTKDGDYLTEYMSAEEVIKIRDESPSVKNEKTRKFSPWVRYFGEMTKKTVIKRASKTWPKTNQHERLQTAVDYLNETQGSDFGEEVHRFKPGEKVTIIEQMREALIRGDDLAVAQLVEEYSPPEQESAENEQAAMKFWALFNSSERRSIRFLLDDNYLMQERQRLNKPELLEPIPEQGL